MLKALCASALLYSVTCLFTVASAENTVNNTSAFPIKPFIAEYNIIHKADLVGKGIRQLKWLESGRYEFSYNTQIDWLIFSDTRKEASTVSFDDNQVVPSQYVYDRKGTGRDKKYKWLYDIKNNQATNFSKKKQKELEIEFPKNIQDKLSYHLQHRINLINNTNQKQYSYPVIGTSGKVRDYAFEYAGEEELMLPIGLIKTIKFKREKNKRSTTVWFAPDLNYLLVKIYQQKGSFEQFEAQLVSVKNTD